MHTEVFFREIKQRIISSLLKATTNINVAVAWLTDEDIIRVLIQKRKEGISVQIVISNSKENFVNVYKFKSFLTNGGSLFIAHTPFMHNKFCIIDNSVIINGSYNWSYSASKSEENIMLFTLNNDVSDNNLLKKFQVKYKYLAETCSFKINDYSHLQEFKNNTTDFITAILKLDEREIILREEFENDVKSSINKSLEAKIQFNYSTLLDRMKSDGGGVNFVKRLLHDEISSGEMKSGFRKLEQKIPHCVNLSLEYLVSRKKYRELFTESEYNFCSNLMKKYNLQD